MTQIPQSTIDELRRLMNDIEPTNWSQEALEARAKFSSLLYTNAPDLIDQAERYIRLEAVLRRMHERGMLDEMVQHQIDEAMKAQP